MAIERISVIPYARKKAIEFFATNLRPNRAANFFFDEVNVTPFVQNASSIIIQGTDVAKYTTGEGILSESTNSFATIIRTVSPNKLYVNDNYLILGLTQYDGATSFTSGSFGTGDIIYQSNDNAANLTSNTFTARVEHWFLANTSLVVTPLSGTANTVASKRVIHLVSNAAESTANRANLSFVQVNNKFPVSSTIKSATDALKTSIVASYSHYHGVVATINPTTTKMNLSSTYTGTIPTKIRITEGSGYGQTATINSMESSNSVAVLSTSIINLDSTSKYSIGDPTVDNNGNLAGVFHLPETSSLKFKTGERLFTITDVNTINGSDSTMRAFARYFASGLATDVSSRSTSGSPNEKDVLTPVLSPVPGVVAPTVQPGANSVDPIIPTTPPPSISDPPFVIDTNRFNFQEIVRNISNFGGLGLGLSDPVAQTFFTPKTGYGIFVSSIDLFFKAKPGSDDAEIPVTVRLVQTNNGYPSQKVIASATVQCNDVNVSDGETVFPRATNLATATKFRFNDPVFLEASNEYAIVVYSDSPSYEIWISELGQTIIGDLDNRRVSEQPYVGSFFRSQNASTWTPYQNEDLMFRINRAVFSTSPVTLTFGTKKQIKDIPFDEIIINATEIEFPAANIDHKLKTTFYSNFGVETSFRNVEPNKPFWFAESTDSLEFSGRRRVIPTSNTTGLQTQVIIDTNNDTISPFFNAENYGVLVSQNIINNGEIYPQNISITNPGIHSNAANVLVEISDSNLYANTEPGSKATATVTLNASGNVVAINITNAGKGYVESPTVTITEPGAPVNASVVITSEDSKFGGNALCRYVTRKVTLADGFDSGDLRVTVRGIRPQGTNIVVYYKVQSSTDNRAFSDIKWRRMYLENDFYSPDLNTPLDFKYTPTSDPRINKLQYIEDNVSYPIGGTFKHFAIKIVLLAECGCAAPTVRNLRAIALPEG